MARQKKKRVKSSDGRQKKAAKGTLRKKSTRKVLTFPDWIGSLFAALFSFFVIYKITPFFPTFSGTTTLLFIIGFIASAVVFSTMHFHSRDWARYLVFGLVFLLFGSNFIAGVGLKFEWLSGRLWQDVSTYTVAPGAAFIWVAILKYSRIKHQAKPPPETSLEIPSFKNNIFYYSIAGAIFLLCALMIFYKLGYYNLGVDEPLLFNAARNFNTKGFSYFETGYDRSWFTAVCIGLSMRLFGDNEWAARLPAAMMGLLFVVSSFYVFTKGWKNRYLALLIPVLCLMNDRFLYQFRIIRMYAFLIPLFLISMYILYQLLSSDKAIYFKNKALKKVSAFFNEWVKLDWKYLIAFVIMIPILIHFHKLSLIILLIAALAIIGLAATTREKKYLAATIIAAGVGSIAYLLIYVVKVRSLGFIRSGVHRMLQEAITINTYYEYMFDNGFPTYTTILLLLGSGAILLTNIQKSIKIFHLISFIGVILSFILMAYLIYNDRGGRDYRYIAHFTPFTVGIGLFTLAFLGKRVFNFKKYYQLLWLLPLLYSVMHFNTDKDRIYHIHAWHPQYDLAYSTIKEQYKPNETIFGMNINKYYFDAKKMAGDKYLPIPRQNKYTLTQLKQDMKKAGSGWITWPIVKMNHINKDVMTYIYKNCRHMHGYKVDDTAIEVFYFNNSK